MNKRAAFPIAIILGLIVILLVGYGVVTVGWNYAKEKYFSERGVFGIGGPSEEKFVPYEGPPLTDDDKTVLDSMNALACALSVVAKGTIDYSICAPQRKVEKKEEKEPESKDIAKAPEATTNAVITGMQTAETTCNGHQYGQSCVQCGTSHVPEGSLKGKMTFEALNQFLVSCVLESKFASEDTFCGKIPAYSLESSTITKTDIDNWFKENAPDKVKEALNDDFYFTLDPSPINHKKDYYICADDDGWDNEIYLYDDYTKDNDCFDTYVNWVDAGGGNYYDQKCTVTSFELPQEVKTIEEWIPGSGDPKYLAYYEAFPIGEEAYWQLDQSSFLIDVVFFGAVLNTIPVVGSVGWSLAKGTIRGMKNFATGIAGKTASELHERAIRELGEDIGAQVGKELGEQAARELIEVFGEGGYKRLIQKDLLYDSLISRVGKEIGDESAERISTETFNLLKENAIERALGRPALSTDEVIGLLKQHSDGLLKNADDLTRAAAREEIERVVRTPVDKSLRDAFTRKQKVKQFFARNLLEEGAQKGTSQFSKEAMEKLFSKKVATEVLEKLPAEAKEQYLKKATSYMDDILLAEGDDILINYAKIMGTADQGIIENAKNQARLFFRESYGSPGTWSNLVVPRLSSPVQLRWRTVKMFGKEIPVIPKFWHSVGASFAATGSDLTNIVWQNRVGRYYVAYLIADKLAQADSINEKYLPHGKDNLAVSTPFMYELGKTFPIPEAKDFYVDLTKQDETHQRLFFASPCRADLSITQTLGSCEIQSSDYLVKMPDGIFVPVERGSIATLPGKTLTPRYFYEELPAGKQREHYDYCFRYSGGVGVGECPLFLAKDPLYADKFMRYIYDKVYVPIADAIVSGQSVFDGSVIYSDSDSPKYSYEDGLWRLRGNFPASAQLAVSVVNDQRAGESLAFTYWRGILMEDPNDRDPQSKQFKKLNYDEFTKRFLLYSGDDPPMHIIQKHMSKLLNNPSGFGDLRDKDSFASIAARNSYYHYYTIDYSDINSEMMVKSCAKNRVGRTSSSALDVTGKIAQNIPILTVKHNEDAYNNYNDGYNYCIRDEDAAALYDGLKWLATGIAIAIDIGVGLTGVGLLVEAPVMALTGAASAWVGKELDEETQWPN